MKKCSRCKLKLKNKLFNKCKSHVDGLQSYCKLCQKASKVDDGNKVFKITDAPPPVPTPVFNASETVHQLMVLQNALRVATGIESPLLKVGLSYEAFDWLVIEMESQKQFSNFKPSDLGFYSIGGVEIKPTHQEVF